MPNWGLWRRRSRTRSRHRNAEGTQSCILGSEQFSWLPWSLLSSIGAGATDNRSTGCGRNDAGDAGGADSLAGFHLRQAAWCGERSHPAMLRPEAKRIYPMDRNSVRKPL